MIRQSIEWTLILACALNGAASTQIVIPEARLCETLAVGRQISDKTGAPVPKILSEMDGASSASTGNWQVFGCLIWFQNTQWLHIAKLVSQEKSTMAIPGLSASARLISISSGPAGSEVSALLSLGDKEEDLCEAGEFALQKLEIFESRRRFSIPGGNCDSIQKAVAIVDDKILLVRRSGKLQFCRLGGSGENACVLVASGIYESALSTDRRFVACWDREGDLTILDVTTGTIVKRIRTGMNYTREVRLGWLGSETIWVSPLTTKLRGLQVAWRSPNVRTVPMPKKPFRYVVVRRLD